MKVLKIFSIFLFLNCLNFEAHGHRAVILDEIPTVNGVATRFFDVGNNCAFESVFRLPGGAEGALLRRFLYHKKWRCWSHGWRNS